MKASAKSHRIWGGDNHWEVRELATGKTVWTGKTFKGARNAHARLTLHITAAQARRMGN